MVDFGIVLAYFAVIFTIGLRARADAASEAVSVELARNLTLARELGFSGTPAFVAGDTPIGGAVGYERLKEALDQSEG